MTFFIVSSISFAGFKLPDAGPLSEKGIENGDVIISVDGNSLDDPKQAVAAMKKLNETSIKKVVVLKRDGETITIEIE